MQSEHKKIFLTLVITIFLMASASALTYQVNTTFDINIVCINAGFCSASADCNVSIFNPDGIVIIDGISATQSASLAFFNITILSNQSDVLGEYQVGGFCKDGSVTQLIDFTFLVTTFGTNLENSGVVYGVLLIIFFLMNLIVFYIIAKLNKENFHDEEGHFVGISLQKYIRVVLIGISYGLIVVTLNLMNAAATTSSQISQFSGIIGGIFSAMLSAAWIWSIIIVIWIAIMAWRDGNFIKEFKDSFQKIEDSFGGAN